MTNRSRSFVLLCLAALLALFGAACGGDDDDDVSSGGDSSSESEAEKQAEDAISSQIGGECAFLGEFAGGLEEQFDFSDALTEGGEIDFGQLFGPLAEEFAEVADAAPSDISDAFQTMSDAISELADELEGISIDFSDPENVDPEAIAKFETLGQTFESGEFEAASSEVEAWIDANCDIDISG